MQALTPVEYTGERADMRDEPCVRVVVNVTPKGGAVSVALPDGRVATLVVQSAEEAAVLAAARIARGGSDLLAADCKPIAHAAADALVAAGMGRG